MGTVMLRSLTFSVAGVFELNYLCDLILLSRTPNIVPSASDNFPAAQDGPVSRG